MITQNKYKKLQRPDGLRSHLFTSCDQAWTCFRLVQFSVQLQTKLNSSVFPSLSDVHKINVEKSFSESSGYFYIGAIIRDWNGPVMAALSKSMPHQANALEMELLAIKDAYGNLLPDLFLQG